MSTYNNLLLLYEEIRLNNSITVLSRQTDEYFVFIASGPYNCFLSFVIVIRITY